MVQVSDEGGNDNNETLDVSAQTAAHHEGRWLIWHRDFLSSWKHHVSMQQTHTQLNNYKTLTRNSQMLCKNIKKN